MSNKNQSEQKPNCIIAARLGSKRIKNKNIRNFLGMPFIAYSIKIALKSKLFNKVYVSTESKKIAKIAEFYGAIVPQLRPNKLAKDNVPIKKVIIDFVKRNNLENIKYNCFIYPVSPMIKTEHLKKAFNKIIRMRYDLIIAIKEFSSNPDRAFVIKKNKKLFFLNKKNYSKRSQDLKKYYSDTGSFFIFKTKQYIKDTFYPKKTTFFLYKSYEVIDVDKYEDLKMLKIIYKNKIK